MGKIDNNSITLLGFIDPYINYTGKLRIITEFSSKWAIEWLLIRLPLSSQITIITGNLTPDLYNLFDIIYNGKPNSKLIDTALSENKLKIGICRDIKLKIWLFNLENQERRLLSISGYSYLTEQGLWKKKGVINYFSFESADFQNLEAEWENIQAGVQWISQKTWPSINTSDARLKNNVNLKPLPKFENILYQTKKLNISISDIQEIVSTYFKISLAELLGKNREAKIALARQVAMFFSCELTDSTITNIGAEFNRNHATVLHSKSKINKMITENLSYSKMITNVRNLIMNEIYSNEI